MDGVTVSFNTCNDHGSVFVFESLRFPNTCCTARYSLLVDACGVITSESNVLDAVTVLGMVRGKLLVVRVQWRSESESKLVLPHNLRAEFPFSSFKAL